MQQPPVIPRSAAGPPAVRDVLDLHSRHVSRTAASMLTLTQAGMEVSSSGAQVRDEQGDAYLDCGGFGVFLLGHCHPRVVEAVVEQVRTHPLATHALVEPHLSAAAAALSAVAPRGMEYVALTNSGDEAVDVGLKLARANGRRRVIAMEGAHHGMALSGLSVTDSDRSREPFLPLLPDVQFVPYGELDELEAALAGPGGPAAVILEPVQGEAGVRIPPVGFLAGARRLCDQHGGLLIVDEVLTGLGRLGAWWGCDAEEVVPDLLLTGKVLSGGVVPVGAVIARTEVFEPLNQHPLQYTSTFGGSPLAAVAVATTVAVLREEGLVERARALGEQILPALHEICDRRLPDEVSDVRGQGLLIGIELAKPRLTLRLLAALRQRRVLASFSGGLRLSPPAVMTDAEVDWLLTAFDEAAADLAENAGGPGMLAGGAGKAVLAQMAEKVGMSGLAGVIGLSGGGGRRDGSLLRAIMQRRQEGAGGPDASSAPRAVEQPRPAPRRFPAPTVPSSPDEFPKLYEWFRERRENQPVFRSERMGFEFWQVFRYEDVTGIMNDHARFSSEVLSGGDEDLTVRMLSRDEPNHHKLRRLVNAAFTRRAIAQMDGRIAEITQDLLDGIREQGRMEASADFATPLPARVIAELLGVPQSDWNVFQRWATGAGEMTGGVMTGAAAASAPAVRKEMAAYFTDLLAERRRSPRADLISELSTAEIDGERLTDREVIGLCSLVLVAGQETARNLLTSFFLLMADNPDSLAELTADPGLVGTTVEEVLRCAPPVWFVLRRTREDVEVGGQRIPEGTIVLPWVASANRDPDRFPDPERFDIRRQPNHHLSFGHGIHFCLGAPLARLQAAVALPMVLKQLPNPQVRRGEDVRIRPGPIFIVENVHVTFDQAR